MLDTSFFVYCSVCGYKGTEQDPCSPCVVWVKEMEDRCNKETPRMLSAKSLEGFIEDLGPQLYPGFSFPDLDVTFIHAKLDKLLRMYSDTTPREYQSRIAFSGPFETRLIPAKWDFNIFHEIVVDLESKIAKIAVLASAK